MITQGYYRFPTIHRDNIVFTCEDDLWTVPASGGTARRLTSGRAEAMTPVLSPDGKWLAYIGREEGHPEVFVMPAEGGQPERRTFLGAMMSQVVGWSRDGKRVFFWSNAAQSSFRMMKLFSVDRAGGVPREEPYGIARYISFGKKGVVIGRHGADPARWKRYKGGTIGQIWIDPNGRGNFNRLVETGGNLSHPMWVGNRVYFHSDHEGCGNLYSVKPDGSNIKRHTDHPEFYLRTPSTDGRRIVYSAGADLFVFDTKTNKSKQVKVKFHSPRTQRNRKFVSPARYLEDFAPHPGGESVALTIRGRVFTMANWEGAVRPFGDDGSRLRLARWLPDGKRIVAVNDESLVILGEKPGKLDIGRPIRMEVSPKNDQVALTNHRHELLLVDLAKSTVKVLDKSPHGRVGGIAWSPDGKWLAYSIPETPHLSPIRMVEVAKGKPVNVTEPVLQDFAPSFDPGGKYLYFLSFRDFDPVYDSMHFDLGFPRGMRPCLVTLQKDVKSPFVPEPKKEEKKDDKKKKGKEKEKPLKIDLDGIRDRVLAFPVPEGRYGGIRGIEGGALFSSYPVEGALGANWLPGAPEAKGTLEFYKFEDQSCEAIINGISAFEVSGKVLYYQAAYRLRAVAADKKPDGSQEKEGPSRKSGWIDVGRAKVSVDPGSEWLQMYDEAWRLMRDHFWVEDMSGVNWKKVGDRYRKLVPRVATRSEFSDLMWETQGELGTSHCYEIGGDYRPEPRYDVGMLGADYEFDSKKGGYRITHLVRGDSWDPKANSPLRAPGVNVVEGDVITAVNGRAVGKNVPPQELLVNLAGEEVTLSLDGGRDVTVTTLRTEYPARYREWVNRNRDWVHQESGGRAGYIHIPDMGANGYSEFHRQYLGEVDRPGLVVDVRYNGGGHVSQLLLEKLRRMRVGYDRQRWGQPVPYPDDSPWGPMVALTNEQAGSDGDIFSHVWKIFKLGPLVGRRTWGGVVGIWPRHALVDGSVTTQPEFAFWFKDVGYGVENYGTDPDVDVDIAPQDYRAGRDPQMEEGLSLLMGILKEQAPAAPDLSDRPSRKPPKLPKRGR